MSRATASRVNPTEFAILGLLAEQPRSGYDIKKEVEERLGHFWSESYGHIYPMLKRLRSRRLITAKPSERRAGRPARQVYAVTAAGRRALTAWFERPPMAPRPRNELLLRLLLGRFAPAGVLRRDVAAYRARAHEGLVRLRAVQLELDAAASDDLDYERVVLAFGIALYTTLGRWCADAEAMLAERG